MKILFIGHEDALNGASQSMLNLIDQLLENKENEIFVLTSYSTGKFFSEINARNVRVIIKPFYRWCVEKNSRRQSIGKLINWYGKESLININTAKEMAEYVKQNGIEIIHSNTSVINIGALIKKYSGVKHVWHIREFGDLDFNMYPLLPKSMYYYELNKGADMFICISKAINAHYSKLNAIKKRIVYNGVSEGNFIAETERTSCRQVRFLIAGRISETKGQKDAIKAAINLLEKGNDKFVVYIAGSGQLNYIIPKQYSSHFIVLGEVSNMPELRRNIDVELVCSKAEAFGRVTAEAMMGGIPVIGSNAGGTPELIQDGITGYLYERGNIEDLANKMQIMIENQERRIEMGKNAQKYALENFTIERCVNEIVDLYHNLIGDMEHENNRQNY